MEGHIWQVDKNFSTLPEAGVTLKMNKCTFFSQEEEHLEHVIRPGKLEVENAHLASFRQAKKPNHQKPMPFLVGPL